MSSAGVILVDIYGPVAFSGIIIGFGWIIREIRSNRKNITDTLAKLASKAQIEEIKYTETAKDVESLMRDFPLMRQNLALLAQEFENHQSWHRDNKQAG